MKETNTTHANEPGNITFQPKRINWSYLNLGTSPFIKEKIKKINSIFDSIQKTPSGIKEIGESLDDHLPFKLRDHARRAKQLVTGTIGQATLFEELGFDYIGPIDGHDM